MNITITYNPPVQPQKPEEVKDRAFIPKAEDKQHKHATFDIYLFSDEYRWKIGHSNILENNKTTINFTPQMQRNLNESEEVICIGASSEQIRAGLTPEEGRKEEELRAAQRAETIATWVRPYLSNHVIVRKLNLGHHAVKFETISNYDRTSEQRRVIIVLVLKKEDGVDVDEALRDAFNREKAEHPLYARILTQYSLTQGFRFSWIE